MEQYIPIFSIKTCFLLVFSVASAACSSFDLIPSDSLIQRLKGRGPVLVSADNPYLAANLLLQQESEHSKELAGFLETKGQPSALSVTQEFLSPAKVKLYYRAGTEQYNLELLQGIWIIRGPSFIEDEEVKSILNSSISLDPPLPARTDPALDKKSPSRLKTKSPAQNQKPQIQESPEPELLTEELNQLPASEPETQRTENSDLTKTEEPAHTQDLVPLFDKNVEQSNQETIEKAKEETTEEPVSEIPAKDLTGSSIEDIISLYAASPAETTPRGDVVHFVTSEQETLGLIASWYTKTELTLSRIARANKLQTSATLSPGDQVVIPAELVKNKMRLPEEAITALAAKSQ